MQRYFITNEELNNKLFINDYHHIANVMRMNIGTEVLICNNKNVYKVSLEKFNDNNSVEFNIIEQVENKSELPINVTIVQGYPKGDKIETIIQKSTELGVSTIYPCLMDRSIVKLDDKKIDKKLSRLRKISKEASEQSHRSTLVNIPYINKIKDIDYSLYNHKIVLYEESSKSNEKSNFKKVLNSLNIDDKLICVIGPEGGLSDKEIAFLKENNFILCGIGPRILRTETASCYLLSAISYEVELK